MEHYYHLVSKLLMLVYKQKNTNIFYILERSINYKDVTIIFSNEPVTENDDLIGLPSESNFFNKIKELSLQDLRNLVMLLIPYTHDSSEGLITHVKLVLELMNNDLTTEHQKLKIMYESKEKSYDCLKSAYDKLMNAYESLEHAYATLNDVYKIYDSNTIDAMTHINSLSSICDNYHAKYMLLYESFENLKKETIMQDEKIKNQLNILFPQK